MSVATQGNPIPRIRRADPGSIVEVVHFNVLGSTAGRAVHLAVPTTDALLTPGADVQNHKRHLGQDAKDFKRIEGLVRTTDHHAVAVRPVRSTACMTQCAVDVPCQETEADHVKEERGHVEDQTDNGREEGAAEQDCRYQEGDQGKECREQDLDLRLVIHSQDSLEPDRGTYNDKSPWQLEPILPQLDAEIYQNATDDSGADKGDGAHQVERQHRVYLRPRPHFSSRWHRKGKKRKRTARAKRRRCVMFQLAAAYRTARTGRLVD
jgi:hypothetical protein